MSNNASLSILIQIFNDFGIDSKMGITASVLQGATETSFYVITIYYGTVGIKKYPYSLIMAIISDILIFIFSLILFYFIL
jgi:spore maturation protein B